MPRVLGGATVLLLLVAAACGDDGGGAERDVPREVAVYAAVITDVAEDLTVEEGGEPSDRVVYVEALERGTVIPIEVQAGVVLELEDEVDVRFVDDREAAVDGRLPGAPVREGAALIALGPVPEGDRRVVVDLRRYEREGDEDDLRVTLERTGDDWAVTERSLVGGRA